MNNPISHELTTNQDYRRFIYIGTLIGSLFLLFFALIDSIFLDLYIDAIAEGVGSIILLFIHYKETQKDIQPWMIIVGISTVAIVLMIGIFANNASDGATIWLAIVPFICFLFLEEKLGFITSTILSVIFISVLSYFCIMYPEKGFNILGVVTSTGALTCSTVLAWAFADNRTRLIALLSKQARTDTLTPLLNRRGLMSYFYLFINLYKKNEQPLAVLILDLDNFKHINDNYGHDIGDEFIIACANLIREELGENDIAARLGGEEYIVLLPNSCSQEAEIFANKVKNAIEDLTIKTTSSPSIKVTASIGISYASKDCSTFQALYKSADEALYRAKSNGRNCIVLS